MSSNISAAAINDLIVANKGFTPESLILEKTVYAKSRKINFNKNDVYGILNLECETHLRKHPTVQFKGMGETRENADRSVTYVLIFEPKQKEADNA